MTRKLFPGLYPVVAFLGSLAGAGCATTSGPVAVPPDAAAIHAAERARLAFAEGRPVVRDPALTARVSEVGLEALAEAPLFAAGNGVVATLGEGWRFHVLDDPKPAAFLFADRTIFVSRGALAALPGEPALVALFQSAATTFASGGFRPVPGEGLVEQPIRLTLPAEPDPEDDPADPATGRERWMDLLDGLLFGEPIEFGVADGPELLLPKADLRLSLPEESAFEPAGRGVFRAIRGAEPLGLTVREIPAAAFTAATAGSRTAEHRAELADLGARLRQAAGGRGAEATFVEALRFRGFTAVRGRVQPLSAEDPRAAVDPDAVPVNRDRGAEPGARNGSASGTVPGASPGLVALLRSEGSLVEVSLACGRRRFDACEALFMAVVGSADRLRDTPVPGPLRIAALAVDEAGSVRDALDRLAAEGRIDGPLAAVESLNRSWLREPLGPGERILILSRDRQRPASGRQVP